MKKQVKDNDSDGQESKMNSKDSHKMKVLELITHQLIHVIKYACN